jgi:uncharacterized protein
VDDEPKLSVSDNAADSRYELRLDGRVVGWIDYELQPGAVVLIHAEVESACRGRGLGSTLVACALDDIRARGLPVVPVCPFIVSHLRRHPEYDDLVARDPAWRS